MHKHKIDRINELGRCMKIRELTPEEKEEQKRLRDEYMAEVRAALWGSDREKKPKQKG